MVLWTMLGVFILAVFCWLVYELAHAATIDHE